MKGFSPNSSFLLILLLLSSDPGAALPLYISTSCCTQLYRQPLPNKLLKKVIYVDEQKADGECHLQAIVLHLARRSVCIHPKNRSLAQWLDRQGKKLQGILPNLTQISQRKTD